MPLRKIITSYPWRYLHQGEWLKALICVSADLEYNLFEMLFLEEKFDPQKIDKHSLGRLIELCSKNEKLKGKVKLLKDFCKTRNRVFHERIYFERVDNDPEAKEYVISLITNVNRFNSKFVVKYDWTQEEKYSNYHDEKRKRTKWHI